jgi:predicted permease
MDFGNNRKVVLTHGFWAERYGGDPDVVGQTLRINRNAYTIVGVLQEGFGFLGERDCRLFVPIPYSEEDRTVAALHNNDYEMIARLAPGATVEQAASQIAAFEDAMAPEVPIPNYQQLIRDVGYRVEVADLRADLLRDVLPTLMMLWVGVAFVLLLGCLNIATLMLARSNRRSTELATRMALGSDRSRLARQLLTEALVVAALGGLLGLAIGAGGLALLGGLGVEDLPRGAEVGIDAGVVGFTLAVALVAGIIFGAIPLVHVFRGDLNSVFRSEGRSGTAHRRAVLLRSGLVTGQVAIAFILLIGAGLMFASLRTALRVDPGFLPDSTLTGFVTLPSAGYPNGQSRVQFFDEMLRQVRAVPGVTEASVTTQIPFGGMNSSSVILPEGYTPRQGESLLSPFNTIVGPGYFATMGIPLLAGRLFDPSDNEGTEQVILIDQWLAERYFPKDDAIGKRMLWGAVPGTEDDREENLYTIIGVVGNIKQNDLTEGEHIGAYYFTYKQRSPLTVTLVARTAVDPLSITGPVRRVVSGIDPDIPFFAPETMEQRVADSLVTRRTPMILLAIFAAVALFLSAVGIYGVLAYSVTQRTRELGIRMALGSSPRDVARLVVLHGVKVLALGLAIGLGGSLLLVRLISSLLYGIQPTDPSVLLSVAILLSTVGCCPPSASVPVCCRRVGRRGSIPSSP